MNPSPFKLALIQMNVEGGQLERNISRACDFIAEAARDNADVALLPECLDLGWTDPSSDKSSEPIPGGRAYTALTEAARQHSIYVCAGITERSQGESYNSAILLSRKGELLLKHQKLNELEIGHEAYALGESLGVASTEFGTIGVMICADAFAKGQVLTRALCYMGADVILSPCAWAVQPDHDNSKTPYGKIWRDSYIPVAKEFSCPIVGVSNVGPISGGPWKGHNCIGNSLAFDADGQEIIQGPHGVNAECVLYATITPRARPARGTGWESI